jgi:hypothetical protein
MKAVFLRTKKEIKKREGELFWESICFGRTTITCGLGVDGLDPLTLLLIKTTTTTTEEANEITG